MDLVEFLTARLDEDEAVARRATPGPWAVDGSLLDAEGNEVVDWVYNDNEAHIARHNPARVLAEVEAKRRIVAEFRWADPFAGLSGRELHAKFAHPDYEYETTTSGRKEDSVEPDGEGWEPNEIVKLPGGRWRNWERFDYYEEEYWRRKLPAGAERNPLSRLGQPPLVHRLLALPYADHPDYDERWRP